MIDRYNHLLDDEDFQTAEDRLTRCRNCGVQCFWEQTEYGWRLMQYSTEKIHQCRELAKQRVADPDEF